MDLSHRLAVSYYQTIAVINESHHIYLVQHQSTKRIFVKKILDVYNIDVYHNLYNHPIPGTPRIIDYCEEDGKLLLIEEYISGTPLSDKIQDHHLNDRDMSRYLSDLCDILEQLHSLNPPVIHRDIKPSNIIITNNNHAVLLDFNAAKQFKSEERQDTILLGTQGYAAPEQYGFGSSTPQTDIYSLGIVLKEMLLSSDSTSVHLTRIAEKCTQLSPKKRYSSVNDLHQALALLTNSHSHLIIPRSVSQILPPGFRTRNPWKMFASSAGYAVILWLSLTLSVKDTYGVALWTERMICLFMLLSIIFISFNYLNIQCISPICQHKNQLIRMLGIALMNVETIFLLLVILIISHSLLST